MKSPRTFLSEIEEAGCRIARIVGTRKGVLMLPENPEEALAIATRLRQLDCNSIPELELAVRHVAGRIERRFFPGLIKVDREGYFLGQKGELLRTEESIRSAREYYNKNTK